MTTACHLRILSYNIHHGAGMDGVLDLDRIANVIHDQSPDLVSLQEVDNRTARTGHVDQAQVLAEKTGLHMAYCPSIDYDGGQYGNAILSRHPIQSTHSAPLPGKEARSAVLATVQLPDNPSLCFIATHLSLIRDCRWESVPLLNQLAGHATAGVPVIMAGDFNTNMHSETIRSFRETWEVAGFGHELKSYPSDIPREQIDYILFRASERLALESVSLIDERVASDHRPFLGVFRLG